MIEKPYIPIDCDFHDELEASATLQKEATFVLIDDRGIEITLKDVIVDLGFIEEGGKSGEFMTLKSGLRYRFDRIVSIDGKIRP